MYSKCTVSVQSAAQADAKQCQAIPSRQFPVVYTRSHLFSRYTLVLTLRLLLQVSLVAFVGGVVSGLSNGKLNSKVRIVRIESWVRKG